MEDATKKQLPEASEIDGNAVNKVAEANEQASEIDKARLPAEPNAERDAAIQPAVEPDKNAPLQPLQGDQNIAGKGFHERPTPPKFLTPEQREAREAEIKKEEENFTADKFSADKEIPAKPTKHVVLASKVIVSIPEDTEDVRAYVQEHLPEMTDRLIVNLEMRDADKNDDGVIRLLVDEAHMNEAGQDERHDENGNMIFFLKEALIDGVTRQVEITVKPAQQSMDLK